MNSARENLFTKVNSRPYWEGIIFTGLDFSEQRISVSMAEPIAELREHIEYIWFMSWDIPEDKGVPCIRIPNPCTKLVTRQQGDETSAPYVFGTNAEVDIFEFRGAGMTIGFDIKPGALFPFTGKSLQDWPIHGVPAAKLFKGMPLPSQDPWTELSASQWILGVQEVLAHALKSSAQNNYSKILPLVNGALAGKFSNPEDMAQTSGTSLRSLQRIFQEEVGTSPRDLLRIARFNEAIRNISGNEFNSFADAALASGFFDQPHMANEFKKLVATSPSQFRRYL